MVFDLEREGLRASGVRGRDRIAEYQAKLHDLNRRIVSQITLSSDVFNRARQLFNWLWKAKPIRYNSHSNYSLSKTIDAQMSQGRQPVGNCLGLTLLYNCLLKRNGIRTEAVWLENAFGIGPHILTLLRVQDSAIDIENILPEGFDFKGHLNDSSRTIWGEKGLVADVYLSHGNMLFKKGKYKEALENYDMAIKLNLEYERARLNKAILQHKMLAKTVAHTNEL